MDRDAEYSAYVAARWPALVRSAVILGCSLDEEHDVVQTALLRCYVAWRRVEQAEDRDGYVYRILLNTFRDTRRRRWWGERPTEVLPEVIIEDESAHVAVADAIHRALADLSDVNREVVVLRYLAQLSERRTADILGIAPGTVKSRLSRALDQLAQSEHLIEGPGQCPT